MAISSVLTLALDGVRRAAVGGCALGQGGHTTPRSRGGRGMGVVVSAGGSVLRGQVRVTGGPWEPVGMRSLPGRRGVGPPRVDALGPADTGPQAQGTLAAPVAVGLSTHAVAPDAAPAVARSPQWGSSHCPPCPPSGPRGQSQPHTSRRRPDRQQDGLPHGREPDLTLHVALATRA